MRVLLYIWQLPQNLLALILTGIFSLKYGKPIWGDYKGINYVWFKGWRSGVSLGNYVLIGDWYSDRIDTVSHEYGHTRQSLFLGPLYLLLIGLPSGLGNLWDRTFHKNWDWYDSYKWYYSQPWEAWADRLGGVDRHFD